MNTQRFLCALTFACSTISFSMPLMAQKDTPDPGPSAGPNEPYLRLEHGNIACSMPLQGNRQSLKYAPVLYGANAPTIANFVTGVAINNPDSMSSLEVAIEYFDRDGTLLLGPTLVSINPLGTHFEKAPITGTTIGTVKIEATPASDAQTFVGATIYYANRVGNPFGVPPELDVDRYISSMQPLQELQANETVLHFGPVPIHSYSPMNSPLDLVNGLFGFLTLVNPGAAVNNIQIVIHSTANPGMPVVLQAQIPGRGALFVPDLARLAFAQYQPTNTIVDQDLTAIVTSISGHPLIGELLMLDLASNADFNEHHLVNIGGRVRLASTMAAYTPATTLVNPELTLNLSEIVTTMGIAKVSGGAIAPVTVTYFSPLGAVLGVDTLPPMGYLQTAILGPNMPQSPMFPTGGTTLKGGWARISTPVGGLIGWSMRGGESSDIELSNRAYADLLWGNGGNEHRFGWLDRSMIRSIAPICLDFLDDTFSDPEPAYIAMVNDSTLNLGLYNYSFWSPTTPFFAGIAGFPGLALNNTSFTYEDAIINLQAPFFMGLVSATNVGVKGICTIGGAFDIPLGFHELPSYPGPGDLYNVSSGSEGNHP